MSIEVPPLNTSNVQLARAYDKVAQLEQKKVGKFDERAQKLDNQMKLVQDIKSKFMKVKESLTPFRTPNDFRDLEGVSSHPDIIDIGGIDKTVADVGSYEFEVLNLANTNSIMTYGMPDRDKSEVGVGYIKFTTGSGEEKDVYIGTDDNTLDGVARAINKAGIGVKAHVVNDGTDSDEPWRLVVAGEGTGWRNDIEWGEFYLLDGDLEFDRERTREAKSATIRFNGHPIMVDENNIEDLLPGININLKAAKEGQTLKVDIKPDFEKIQEKAENFVTGINDVLSFIQTQNQLGPDSYKDPTKGLAGDVGLKSIESRMRNIIQLTQNAFEGPTAVKGLRDVGITFNRNGTLDFDAEKFQKNLEANFESVSTLFAGTGPLNGFATEMIQLVDGMVRSGDGMMTIKESALRDRMERVETDKERATERAERRLAKTSREFSRADAAMQRMANISQSIPQGGGGIPGF